MPFPDSSYDLIHSSYAVENFSDDPSQVEGILYDWDRLLRPGGHAVLTSVHDFYVYFNFRKLLEDMAHKLEWQPHCNATQRCSVADNPASITLIFQKPLPGVI